MEISKNMADVLLKIKEERDLSLTDFAEQLGISRSALQEYTSGTGVPRLSTVVILAQKLGMEPADLLAGTILQETLDTEEQQAVVKQLLAEYAQQSTTVLEGLHTLLALLAESAENCPNRQSSGRPDDPACEGKV